MIAHPKSSILMEIAKEAEVNPEAQKEFEIRECGEWFVPHTLGCLLYEATKKDSKVRRRPKTVRVSGEVADDIIAKAKRVAHASPIAMSITEARDIAQIFLDLSED